LPLELLLLLLALLLLSLALLFVLLLLILVFLLYRKALAITENQSCALPYEPFGIEVFTYLCFDLQTFLYRWFNRLPLTVS
jgi:hypothetical protein